MNWKKKFLYLLNFQRGVIEDAIAEVFVITILSYLSNSTIHTTLFLEPLFLPSQSPFTLELGVFIGKIG